MVSHTRTRTGSLKAAMLVGLALYLVLSSLSTYSWSAGPNYRNVSVDTRVNITNALPEVLGVFVSDGFGNITNITLNAGSTKMVYCNVTVRDYDNIGEVNVSATFYKNETGINDTTPDDNNTHYTNLTCGAGSPSGFERNYSCSFAVLYYANAGRWICNATAHDPYPFTNASANQSGMNVTNINGLLALNVTPLIDYGDMAVGDISSAPEQANVTNFGNLNINVSVKGYGRNISDGLAFVCDVGNISVQYEKYNAVGGVDLSTYVNLSNTLTRIGGLMVPQQTNDSQQSINATYWMLQVPPNPFGLCNGTVIFQAETS